MEQTFAHKMESGQRVAIVLVPADGPPVMRLSGADEFYYKIGEETTEAEVKNQLGDDQRLAAIVNVE